MEINIELVLKNDKLKKFDIKDKLSLIINKDCFDNVEEVYDYIIDHIYEQYGITLHFGEDFDIDEYSQEILNQIYEFV